MCHGNPVPGHVASEVYAVLHAWVVLVHTALNYSDNILVKKTKRMEASLLIRRSILFERYYSLQGAFNLLLGHFYELDL